MPINAAGEIVPAEKCEFEGCEKQQVLCRLCVEHYKDRYSGSIPRTRKPHGVPWRGNVKYIQLIEPLDPPQYPWEITANYLHREKKVFAPVHESQVVEVLVKTYLECGRGLYAKQIKSTSFFNMMKFAGWKLHKAGVSVIGYVQFVCGKWKAKNGRFPLPAIVFGQKAIDAWLPEYIKDESNYTPGLRIIAPPEVLAAQKAEWERRLAEHRVKIKAARAESLALQEQILKHRLTPEQVEQNWIMQDEKTLREQLRGQEQEEHDFQDLKRRMQDALQEDQNKQRDRVRILNGKSSA